MATSKNKGLKRPPTLTDEVARLLTKNIKDGVYGPGEKLPTETKLCEIYGISRPVLREAISQLKFDGLVVNDDQVNTPMFDAPAKKKEDKTE